MLSLPSNLAPRFSAAAAANTSLVFDDGLEIEGGGGQELGWDVLLGPEVDRRPSRRLCLSLDCRPTTLVDGPSPVLVGEVGVDAQVRITQLTVLALKLLLLGQLLQGVRVEDQ